VLYTASMKPRRHYRVPKRLNSEVTERDIGLCFLFIAGLAVVLWLVGSLAIDAVKFVDETGTSIAPSAPMGQFQAVTAAESRDLSTILNRALLLGLIALGLWWAYRLFMAFCNDLDEAGHWNHMISKRGHRHHH